MDCMDNIIIENKTHIDIGQEFLLSLMNEAALPLGKILFIFNNDKVSNNLGECIPKSLYEYSSRENILSPFIDKSWDCAIVMSQKACHWKEKYPAFFVYLLGHELGHAYICLSDLSLHIFSCLIDRFIKEASSYKITEWHQLPHEIRFDQFGIYIAEHLFSREKLNIEINHMLNDPDCKDHARLKMMLSLSGSNFLGNLRSSLTDFAKLYKEELIELWEKDINTMRNGALASLIGDFDALFQ